MPHHANSGSFKKGNIPPFKGKTLSTELRKKLSEARLNSPFRTGPLHPKWKGGKRGYFGDQGKRILIENGRLLACAICHSEKKVQVHHKNKNWSDNSLENLEFLCQSCHIKHHHNEDKTKNVCVQCGVEFFSKRVKRMFCTIQCSGKFYRSKRKNRSLT